jgi:hypothetical protein
LHFDGTFVTDGAKHGQYGGVSKNSTSRNRILDDRLWDDTGREWRRVEHDLGRPDVARLLTRPDVRVGIHACRRWLRWVAGGERNAVWVKEIEPNFHDRPDYRPPPGAPGQLPFHATLWRDGDDELLLFDDFD